MMEWLRRWGGWIAAAAAAVVAFVVGRRPRLPVVPVLDEDRLRREKETQEQVNAAKQREQEALLRVQREYESRVSKEQERIEAVTKDVQTSPDATTSYLIDIGKRVRKDE